MMIPVVVDAIGMVTVGVELESTSRIESFQKTAWSKQNYTEKIDVDLMLLAVLKKGLNVCMKIK